MSSGTFSSEAFFSSSDAVVVVAATVLVVMNAGSVVVRETSSRMRPSVSAETERKTNLADLDLSNQIRKET